MPALAMQTEDWDWARTGEEIPARDWWSLLGVPAGSNQQAVRKAYLKAALATHPDKTGWDPEAFHAVQAAYSHLTDVKASLQPNGVAEEASRSSWQCSGYVYAVSSVPGGVISVGDSASIMSVEQDDSGFAARKIAVRSIQKGLVGVGLLACCLFDHGQDAAVGASDGSVHCVDIHGGTNHCSQIWQHSERKPIIALAATSKFIVCAAADCAYFYVLSLDLDLPFDAYHRPVCAVHRICSEGQVDAIALVENRLVTSGSRQDVADSGFVSCWKLDADLLESNLENEPPLDMHLWTVSEGEPVFSVAVRRSMVAWVAGPTCRTFDIAEDLQPESPLWTQHSAGRDLRAVAISPFGRLVAACGVDEAVYMWHNPSGTVAAVFNLNNVIHCCLSTSCINCVTFTSDGNIATGGYDRKLTIWQLPDQIKESQTFLQVEKWTGLVDGVGKAGDTTTTPDCFCFRCLSAATVVCPIAIQSQSLIYRPGR